MNSVTSSGSHSPPKLRSNACAPHPSPHANASAGGCMRVRGGVRCLNGCGCGCGGVEVLKCAAGVAGQRIGDGDLCGVTAVAYRFAALRTRSCCSAHGACGLCLPHQHCPCITHTLLRGLARTGAWPMTATVDSPSTERGTEVLSRSANRILNSLKQGPISGRPHSATCTEPEAAVVLTFGRTNTGHETSAELCRGTCSTGCAYTRLGSYAILRGSPQTRSGHMTAGNPSHSCCPTGKGT